MSMGVVLSDLGGWNDMLFHCINSSTPEPLVSLVKLLAIAGSFWIAPLVALYLWLCSPRAGTIFAVKASHNILIRFAVGLTFALAVGYLLKVALGLPRPSDVFGNTIRVIGEADSKYSFPSGHATFSALAVMAISTQLKTRLRWLLILFPALVGWSRIAAGMHFPIDVLAGWVLGIASMWVAIRLGDMQSAKRLSSKDCPK